MSSTTVSHLKFNISYYWKPYGDFTPSLRTALYFCTLKLYDNTCTAVLNCVSGVTINQRLSHSFSSVKFLKRFVRKPAVSTKNLCEHVASPGFGARGTT